MWVYIHQRIYIVNGKGRNSNPVERADKSALTSIIQLKLCFEKLVA